MAGTFDFVFSGGVGVTPDIDTVLAQGGTLTADRTIDGGGNYALLIKNPNSFIISDGSDNIWTSILPHACLFGDVGAIFNSTTISILDQVKKISLTADNIVKSNSNGDGAIVTNFSNLTSFRDRTEPDKDGTYAMTSDLGGTPSGLPYGSIYDFSVFSFTVGIYDFEFTTGTGASTVLLPINQNAELGTTIIISDLDAIALTSNITINAGSGNTINGTTIAQTFVMNINGQCITLKKVTANRWKVQ